MAVTRHQLDVLETYAATGSYKITAARMGLARATVSGLLGTLRCHYGAATSVQAYRAAIIAGDLVPSNTVPVAASG